MVGLLLHRYRPHRHRRYGMFEFGEDQEQQEEEGKAAEESCVVVGRGVDIGEAGWGWGGVVFGVLRREGLWGFGVRWEGLGCCTIYIQPGLFDIHIFRPSLKQQRMKVDGKQE
jgi:hypothetical protein